MSIETPSVRTTPSLRMTERIDSPITREVISPVRRLPNSPMSPEFEQEFFSLAAVWLDCRLKLLHAETPKDRMWYFLGETDYQTEMRIMIEEERRNRGRSNSSRAIPPEPTLRQR